MKKNITRLSLWKILLIALAFVAGSFLAKMVFSLFLNTSNNYFSL